MMPTEVITLLASGVADGFNSLFTVGGLCDCRFDLGKSSSEKGLALLPKKAAFPLALGEDHTKTSPHLPTSIRANEKATSWLHPCVPS